MAATSSYWTAEVADGAVMAVMSPPRHYQLASLQQTTTKGEWWNDDVRKVMADALSTGSDFQPSDANTINGQPGDLLPCSSDNTFRVPVKHGETYMLRIINAALTNGFFFAIAGHRLTVVSSDASYTKPFTTDHIFIESGQTMTVLLKARRRGHSNAWYYMAARPLATNPAAVLDNSTATAVLEYIHSPPADHADFPTLPSINDSSAAAAYTARLRSLASKEHPADVPRSVDEHMLVTVAVNEISCAPNEAPCKGPHGNRFASSLNNISFEAPQRDILGAYYRSAIGGVAKTDFPDNPPLSFNFTADSLPPELALTARGTRVKFLAYGTVVEVVFQGTTILGGDSHPMHLHGFSFYVVGRGLGNFDRHHDPAKYNLVDPPYQNTVSVAKNGWAAIRFRAANPALLAQVRSGGDKVEAVVGCSSLPEEVALAAAAGDSTSTGSGNSVVGTNCTAGAGEELQVEVSVADAGNVGERAVVSGWKRRYWAVSRFPFCNYARLYVTLA
ncbi:hypothetical protein ACQ4PT_005446 [Festuca glaucescens]